MNDYKIGNFYGNSKDLGTTKGQDIFDVVRSASKYVNALHKEE
jgi:hypothetical protein